MEKRAIFWKHTYTKTFAFYFPLKKKKNHIQCLIKKL